MISCCVNILALNVIILPLHAGKTDGNRVGVIGASVGGSILIATLLLIIIIVVIVLLRKQFSKKGGFMCIW